MGCKLSRSQKFVKVQDLYYGQMRALPTEAERRWVPGCNGHFEFVMGAGTLPDCPRQSGRKSKKCDNLSRDLGKQLTHIVRVMGRIIFVLPILLFFKSQVFKQIRVHAHCYFFSINISIEFNYYFFSSVACFESVHKKRF